MMKTLTSSVAVSALLVAVAAGAQARGVTDADLARTASGSWLHANGSWDGSRFSNLTELSAGNVSQLGVKWIYSVGGETDAQATPLAHDGLVFLPQDNSVHAVDAGSGARVWKFDHELPEDWGGQFVPFFTGKHRGLAISGNNIYFLSNDCTLYGLNQKSGEVAVQHKVDRPYPKDFEKSTDGNGYFCTAGPLAIPGQIIVPMNATDTGGLQGYVHGHDAETGEQLWAANMIPGPGEPGGDTWPGDSRLYGGAGPWIVGSWDAELKMYYTGTANAYPWNPYTERDGRGAGNQLNVGAAAVVAVNTDSGKVAWRYTVVPGDPWDYDTMQTPMLATIDGRRTVVQPNKTGYTHYLDAATGQYLQSPQFADKITWANGYDSSGAPIWAQAIPPEGESVEVWPSLLGGVNMSPSAINPMTGMVYLPRREAKMSYVFEKVQVTSNVRNLGSTFEVLPGGTEVNSAHSLKDGTEAWRLTVGKDGDAGGMLTTAGNLTIFATQGGMVHAVNATTGEVLYTFNTNSTSHSGPATYLVDGKQLVTFALGGLPTFGSAPDDNPVNHSSIMVTFGR
jgi:alcohol dehydrogenase (cytochrome c)|tara:strand:+ start:1828 stop:3522 length:1695 start_codon:yes stop_codon:yes gene_type:complete